MRLSKRLSRTKRLAPKPRTVKAPPPSQLLAESAKLRQMAGNDRGIATLCDAVEEIAEGYLRIGGPDEPRRWPLHPAWKGREPPENP